MRSRLFVGAVAALLLAACGQPPAPANGAAPNADQSATIGGDGSAIDLQSLAAGDMPSLSGELGCSFSLASGQAPILVAMGFVATAEPSFAAVKNSGVVETLQSQTADGYDGMVDGVAFGGRGLTIIVAPGQARETGNEQVEFSATLTAQRADGASRTYEGAWTCGP